ncbi:MAG: orotidine-5'-phosphate decarboxylase [Clostridiales bacterium]|nr:orotidine-5'-phosphate decarboxylase [Clostridiales bacterium]
MFIDRLIERVIATKNPSVIGLDPLLRYVPENLRRVAREAYGDTARAAADAIYHFNRQIIDAVYDIVPVVKPQLAYYEQYGHWGVEAFFRTALYAKERGLIVIADGKRNDIGSTASAYADAYLGETDVGGETAERAFETDALTVNPYLGIDGIEPFLANCKKFGGGLFVLVKTSNPSSGQFQDLALQSGKLVYEEVADLVDAWGGGDGLVGTYGYSSVGAVVGATYPEQAKALRARMRRAYFLVPGFGAQGGKPEDAAAAFDISGLGAVVNASRSVLCAWSHERWGGKFAHEDFAEAARAEALRMKAELTRAIKS